MRLPGLAAQQYLAGHLEGSAADREAISNLLATYTRAVSAGDEQAFTKLLLNEDIPFSYVDSDTPKDATSAPAVQR